MCVSGAIQNYTNQLGDYDWSSSNVGSSNQDKQKYNRNNKLRGSTTSSLSPSVLLDHRLEDDGQQIREALMFVTQYVFILCRFL